MFSPTGGEENSHISYNLRRVEHYKRYCVTAKTLDYILAVSHNAYAEEKSFCFLKLSLWA